MRASVSVYLALKGGEEHIKELIASVLPQLSDSDEIVIAGADAAQAAVGSDDSRIKLSEGPARSFYDAAKLCKNDIVFLCDSADVWAEDKVEKVTEIFDSDPDCTVVLHDMYTFRDSTEEKGRSAASPYKKGFHKNIRLDSYQDGCMAVRRSFIEKALPAADAQMPAGRLWGLLSERHGKTVYIPEKLVYRRISDENTAEKSGSFFKKLDQKRKLFCEYEVLEDAYYGYTGGKITGAGPESRLKKAAWLFIILFTADCCIFGAGRLIDFGYISFRMLLFAAAFILSLPFVIKNRKRLFKDPFVYLTLLFGAALIIWSVYGYIRGNSLSYIRADVFSCLTFVLLPGVLCIVDSKEKVQTLVDVIFYSSVFLAVFAAILQFTYPHGPGEIGDKIYSIIDYYQVGGFSRLETGTYRMFFRSGIFTQVAVMLGIWKVWHANTLKKRIVFIIFEGILVYAWIVSYTRGFWAGLGASVLFVLVWQPKVFGKCFKVALCALLTVVVITGFSWINEGAPNVPIETYNRIVITVEQSTGTSHGGKHSSADIYAQDIRLRTKKMQKEFISQDPVFGRGTGAYLEGLRIEPQVEYTYLDILMKMGAVGAVPFALAFFVFLRRAFIHRVFRPRRDAENSFYTLTTLIMAAYIGVAVTSITNPFLLSPLGITPLLITEAAVYNCRIFDKKVV